MDGESLFFNEVCESSNGRATTWSYEVGNSSLNVGPLRREIPVLALRKVETVGVDADVATTL